MIQEYKSKANLGIALGLTISVISRIVLASGAQSANPAPALVLGLSIASLLGSALFIWGCVMYAKAKGRNGWWGAFGLLSLIGLIVLVCLKDFAADGYSNRSRGFAPVMRGNGGNPPRM